MLYRRSTVPDTRSICHHSSRPALRPPRTHARVHGRVSVSARPWHTALALGADTANAESSCQLAPQRAELASLRSTLAKQVEGFDAPRVETSQPVVVLAAAVVLSLVTRIPDWQQDLSDMDANNAVVSFLEEKEKQAKPLSPLPFLSLLAAKGVLNASRPREHKLRSKLRLRYRLINWAYLHHASTYTAGEIKVNLVPALWAAAGELDPWFKTPKAASMIRNPELRSQLWPADAAAHAYMPIIISLLNAQAVCKFRDRVQVIPASQAATRRGHKRNSARRGVVHRDTTVRTTAASRGANRSTSTRVRCILPRFSSLSKVVWRRRREAAPQSRTSNRMVSIVQLVDALNTAIDSVGEAEGVGVAEEAADVIIVNPMTVGATSRGGDTAVSIRDVAPTVSTLEANTGAVVALVEDVAAMGSTLGVDTGASAAAVEDVAGMGSTLGVGTGASAAAVEDVAGMGSTLGVGTGASAAAVEDVAGMGSTLGVGTRASAAAVEEVTAMGSTMRVGAGASAAAVEDVAAMGSTLGVGTGASAAVVEDVAAMGSTLGVGTGASAAAVEDDAAMGSTLGVGTGASAAAVEDVAAMGCTLRVGTGASAAAVEDVAAMGSTLGVGTGASAAAVEDVAAMGSTLGVGTGASAAAVEDAAAMGSTLGVGTGASAAAVDEVAGMGSTLGVGTGASAAAVEDVAGMGSTLGVGTGASAAAVDEVAAMGSTLGVGTGASAAAVDEVAAMGSTLGVGTGASAASVDEVAGMGSTLGVGTGASAAAVDEVAAMGSTLGVGTGASAAAVEDAAAISSTLGVGTGASAAAVDEVAAMGSTLGVGTGARAAAVEDVSGCYSAMEDNAAAAREKETMKPGLPIADCDSDENEVPAHSLQHYNIPIPTLPEMDVSAQDLLSLLVQIASCITAVSGNIKPSENFKELAFRAPPKTYGLESVAKESSKGYFDVGKMSSAALHLLRVPWGQQFVTCLDVNVRYFISQTIVRSVEPHLVALQDVALLLDPTDDALIYLVAQGADVAASKPFSSGDILQQSDIPMPLELFRLATVMCFCRGIARITHVFSGANPSEAACAIARYGGDNDDDQNMTGCCRTAALSARTAICHLLMNNAPVLYGLDEWEDLPECLGSDMRYVVSQLILQSTEPTMLALRPVALRLYTEKLTEALLADNMCPPSPDLILHSWQMAALADWADFGYFFSLYSGYSEEIQKRVLKDKRAVLLVGLLLSCESFPHAFSSAFAYLLHLCPGATKRCSLPMGFPKLNLPPVSGNYIRLEDWPYVVSKYLQSITQRQSELRLDQSASPSEYLEVVLCLAMDYSCPEGAQTQEGEASTLVRQVVELVERGPLPHAAFQVLAKTITASTRPQIAALWVIAWELDPTKDMAKHSFTQLLSFPPSSAPELLVVRSILDRAASGHWSDVAGVAMTALQSLDREQQQLVLSEGGASSLVVLLVDNALKAKATEEAPPSMRTLLAHLLHFCQGAITHSTTSDLLPPVHLAAVSQISVSLEAWRYVVPGCLRICARWMDASVELEPLMEQILVLAMTSSASLSVSSPEATAAALKELFPPNTEGDPFSCLSSGGRRILGNIIACSVEVPLTALQPVAWEIHPSEGTACLLDIPGCVTTSSVLLNILRMAADEHWRTRGKAAADVLQRLSRDEQQVVLSKGGGSNLVVLLVDNALAAKSASEALTTMCNLLAHLLHVCPRGTTQSEFLVSLPPVDLVPVSEMYNKLRDWQYIFQGCIHTRGRWLHGSDSLEAVNLDRCVESVLSLAFSCCLDPRAGSSSEEAVDVLNLLLAHEGQEAHTELDRFAILSPDDCNALANIIVQSAEAALINLRPVAWQLHPHEDIAKHLLSEFASSPSSDLLLSIMRVAVAADMPWSGMGEQALSALQLMPLEAQERVLKDGGLSHLVLLMIADTATAADATTALSSVSLAVSYLMLAHTADTTHPELLAVLPPACGTGRLVEFLDVCEQWMEEADVETASQLEQCIGQMLMMAMSPAGPVVATYSLSVGSNVWILQECLLSAKALRSPMVLEHAHKMLEALCDQMAASEPDAKGRRLATACYKLLGWVSDKRKLTTMTLSPPWLLPLLGTMCRSLAISHGGPSWTKDVPPGAQGQGLLFAATTCNLQGHYKEVLQLMDQYLSKNKKLPNTMVDATLQACVHQQKWDTVGWPLLEALQLGLHLWSSDDGMKKGMGCLKKQPVEQARDVLTLMEACMYDEQVSPDERTPMSLAAAGLVLTFQPVNESSLCKVLDAYAVCAESALDHCSTASDDPPEGILDPSFHCREAEELVQRLCSETHVTEEEEGEEGTPPVVNPSALIYTALISVYAAAQQPTEAVRVAVDLSMAPGALRHPCCKTLPALVAKPGQRALPACWWTRSHLALPDWLEVVQCSMQVAASHGYYMGVSYLFQEVLLQAGAVQHEGIIQEVQDCLPDDDQATSSPDQEQLLSDVIEALGEVGYYHMEDWEEGSMLKADTSWLARLRVNNASSRKYVQDRMDELAQPWVAPSCDDLEGDQLEGDEEYWTPYCDDGEDSKDEGVEDNAAESQPVDKAEIVAYFGGMAFKLSDQQWLARLYPNRKLQWYGSSAVVGRQALESLIQSIKAGRVNKVFIQTNWNGHCGTALVARVCRKHKVSYLRVGAKLKMDELAQPWVAPSCDDLEGDQLEGDEEYWTPYCDDGEDSKDEGVEDNAAESQPVDKAEIVAYFGGMAFKLSDQQWLARLYPNRKLQWYGSSAVVGRQALESLIQSIKAGRVNKVFIQTNWNGHCGTALVARVCRKHKVSYLRVGAKLKMDELAQPWVAPSCDDLEGDQLEGDEEYWTPYCDDGEDSKDEGVEDNAAESQPVDKAEIVAYFGEWHCYSWHIAYPIITGIVPPDILPILSSQAFKLSDQQWLARLYPNRKLQWYGSSAVVGRQALESLIQSIKAGRVNKVFIQTNWNGHCGTALVARVCRKHKAFKLSDQQWLARLYPNRKLQWYGSSACCRQTSTGVTDPEHQGRKGKQRMDELAQPWVAPSCDDLEGDQLEGDEEYWTPYCDDGEDSKDEGVEDNAAESQPVDKAEIVAYFGGMAFKLSDQQWLARLYPNRKLQWYGSSAVVGRQALESLIQSIKAGRVNKVFIQTNWNGHCGTALVARVCRKHKGTRIDEDQPGPTNRPNPSGPNQPLGPMGHGQRLDLAVVSKIRIATDFGSRPVNYA
eukprot:gene24523-10127_t